MSAPRGGGCLLRGAVCSGGCLLPGGDCSGGPGLGGLARGGGSAPRVGGGGIPACTEADTLPPPLDRITDACKNITLAQLRCGR